MFDHSAGRLAFTPLLFAMVAAVLSQPTLAATYSLIELSPLGGTHSVGYAVNNSGLVVGASNTQNDAVQHATLWDTSAGTIAPVDLETFGAVGSVAYDVSNSGQIAGTANQVNAIQWASGSNSPTGLSVGGAAYSINDLGQLVGGSNGIPTLWDTSGGTVSTTGLGGSGIAWDINSQGQVAGYSTLFGGHNHATLWEISGGLPTASDLGTLGGFASDARAINNVGQVVGHSQIAENTATHATLWDGSSIIDLGTLGGTYSSAHDINDSGTIVGYSFISGEVGPTRATIWQNSLIFNLNDLLDLSAVGWVLLDARGINSKGQIVGLALDPNGEERGYLLTPNPVPIPATLPLFATGLGVLAWMARGRKRRAEVSSRRSALGQTNRQTST